MGRPDAIDFTAGQIERLWYGVLRQLNLSHESLMQSLMQTLRESPDMYNVDGITHTIGKQPDDKLINQFLENHLKPHFDKVVMTTKFTKKIVQVASNSSDEELGSLECLLQTILNFDKQLIVFTK